MLLTILVLFILNSWTNYERRGPFDLLFSFYRIGNGQKYMSCVYLLVSNSWIKIWDIATYWAIGLVVWFSFWVREVPGSIPGLPLFTLQRAWGLVMGSQRGIRNVGKSKEKAILSRCEKEGMTQRCHNFPINHQIY